MTEETRHRPAPVTHDSGPMSFTMSLESLSTDTKALQDSRVHAALFATFGQLPIDHHGRDPLDAVLPRLRLAGVGPHILDLNIAVLAGETADRLDGLIADNAARGKHFNSTLCRHTSISLEWGWFLGLHATARLPPFQQEIPKRSSHSERGPGD